MAEVLCEVAQGEVEVDVGYWVRETTVTCTRCGHETQSLGVGGASVRRCLALMREQCPYGEHNFYEEE